MFNRRFIMYMACAILLNPIIISADDTVKQPTLAEHVKNQYLSSAFGNAEEIIATTTTDPNASFIEKFKQQIDAKTQLLTPRETQEVAFALVSSTQKLDTQ